MKITKKLITFFLILTVFTYIEASADGYDNYSNINITSEIVVTNINYDEYSKAVLSAYKDGNLIWKYSSKEICTSNRDISRISDVYVNGNSVYIAVDQALYAINILSGEVKWNASEVGRGNSIAFDDCGNIYIGSYCNKNYDFKVFDRNGNVLYQNESDDYYSGITGMEVEKNTLKVFYGYDSRVEEFEVSRFSNKDIKVILNSNLIVFDQLPIVINGRTLVPVRAVVEAMNGQVEWDDITQTVTLSCGSNKILLTIDSTTAYLNGNSVVLDVAPQVINGRTLLPIRFVAESFGYVVDWVEDTKTVDIHNDATINYELLNCIGMTKSKICEKYGPINNSEYYLGGKYYIHSNMKSQMFYENEDDVYNYEIHDDAPQNAECLNIYASLSELIKGTNKTSFSVNELAKIFGEYKLENYLDDDMFPLCYYKFKYGMYNITIESDHLNPIVEYVTISQ